MGLERWIHIRHNSIEALKRIAEDANLHSKNQAIAGTTGVSVGLVGSAIAIGGFAAAFFTFGTSLVLSILGGAIGAAGGMTSGGAYLTVKYIIKKLEKEANDCFKEDAEAFVYLTNIIELAAKEGLLTSDEVDSDTSLALNANCQFEENEKKFASQPLLRHSTSFVGKAKVIKEKTRPAMTSLQMFKDFGYGWVYNPTKTGVRLAARVVGTADAAIDAGQAVTKTAATAFRTLGTFGKVVHIGGGVLTVMALPLEIYSLVSNVIDLSKDSYLSTEIHTIITKMEEEIPRVDQVEDIVNAMFKPSPSDT